MCYGDNEPQRWLDFSEYDLDVLPELVLFDKKIVYNLATTDLILMHSYPYVIMYFTQLYHSNKSGHLTLTFDLESCFIKFEFFCLNFRIAQGLCFRRTRGLIYCFVVSAGWRMNRRKADK